jgi:hypothetical protein
MRTQTTIENQSIEDSTIILLNNQDKSIDFDQYTDVDKPKKKRSLVGDHPSHELRQTILNRGNSSRSIKISDRSMYSPIG